MLWGLIAALLGSAIVVNASDQAETLYAVE
jgi:hypothetical protein